MLFLNSDRYDTTVIYDEKGLPVGSVVRPTDPRLFGPDKGTVFLNRVPPRIAKSQESPQAA